MEKKNLDWSNIGFTYMTTDKRYVSNFKNGKWDCLFDVFTLYYGFQNSLHISKLFIQPKEM